MRTTTLEYRGFDLVVTNETCICQVNVGTNDPRLLLKLGYRIKIIDGPGRDAAITNARQFVDELLGVPVAA